MKANQAEAIALQEQTATLKLLAKDFENNATEMESI
eukprot:CAMPEP_0116881410 /NCGR_PEP_ID=MMETSP0463-20121206/13524_1 /TAXON_ID=181622 /ORGANISM="Strombidinopsis sp, Strain SopsisLIS2011" /LENGTH=35 /DNA_ID= /DNA_START= /DNA_END= /DNA_ORIENTATION=